MMNRSFKIILIFSLALNIGVLSAVAYHIVKRPMKRWESPEYRMKRARVFWEDKLNLTPQQSDKIDELWHKRMQMSVPYIEKMRNHRIKLLELFNSENPDREKILEEIKEMNSIRSELSEKVIDMLLNQNEFLTPEQRAIYFRFMAERFLNEGEPPEFREKPPRQDMMMERFNNPQDGSHNFKGGPNRERMKERFSREPDGNEPSNFMEHRQRSGMPERRPDNKED